MDILSKRMRDLREDSDLKQSELCGILDISQSGLSQYENGREPPLEVILKYAEYFNVSVEYLLGRSTDKVPPKETLTDVLAKLNPILELAGVEPIAPSTFTKLAAKLLAYYQGGAVAGNSPAEALNGYLKGMSGLLDALKSGLTTNIVAALNEITIQQLATMDVLSEYLKTKNYDAE